MMVAEPHRSTTGENELNQEERTKMEKRLEGLMTTVQDEAEQKDSVEEAPLPDTDDNALQEHGFVEASFLDGGAQSKTLIRQNTKILRGRRRRRRRRSRKPQIPVWKRLSVRRRRSFSDNGHFKRVVEIIQKDKENKDEEIEDKQTPQDGQMEEEEIQNDRENNHENIQQKGVYEDGDMEDGKYSKI